MEKYQTGSRRISAAIIDGCVFIPFMVVDYYLADTTNLILPFGWMIFHNFISIFYSIFLHARYGQTMGKWFMDIKIMDISENRIINLKQAILRDFIFIALIIIDCLSIMYIVFWTPENIENIISQLDLLFLLSVLVWLLIEIITMVMNDKRRAFHDYIAGTVVVKTDVKRCSY